MKKRLLVLAATAALVVILAAALGSGGPAQAANIEVTTLADENGTGSACSLREAITAANTDTATGGCPPGMGADLITFAVPVPGTIALSAVLPAVESVITIQGPGAATLTLSGQGAVQVLQVAGGGTLTLAGVTVAEGWWTSGFSGGAIFNTGTLTVMDSAFTDNVAFTDDASEPVSGGAIFNTGTLAVTNSIFSGNRVAGSFEAIGGAIANRGTLRVTDTTFAGNSSTVAGGAIGNNGMLTVTNTTFAGNSSIGGGGAILSQSGTSTIIISNSTFAGNSGRIGGAILGLVQTLSITNSTFAGNSTFEGAAITNSSSLGTVTLRNTVLGTNQGGNCDGAVVDGGGNLSADATCAFSQSSSRNSIDPRLDSAGLRDNGGPTQTIALLSGSPAIDAGVSCPPPATDQRGEPRSAPCDSGAFEEVRGSVTLTGVKTCTRTSATTADCTLALTITPPTSGTNTLTVTTDLGAFGEVTAAGSPATCSPGVASAAGPATVTLTLPIDCSGVTLSETLRDLPAGATTVIQTATLTGPDNATGTFPATLGTAPLSPAPSPRPPMEEVRGFRQAAGLRLTCPPLASVRQIVTCTVVPVDAAGTAAVTAPGVIEVSSLAGGLVTASGTRSTNLRIPCGGPVQTPPTLGTPIDPNTCQGVTFQIAVTGVGLVEVRARYEPDSAPAAAGIGELETVVSVTFVAG